MTLQLPLPPSRPQLSVAMCTYNGSRYVGIQIDSILRQTTPIDELIVSDDGSTDGTIDIIREKFSGIETPRLILLQGERLGITRNFERALSACNGELLFLCDQDDVWLPKKVETLVHFMDEHPDVLLAFSDARLVDAEAHDLGSSQFEMVRLSKRLIQSLNGSSPLTALLRRNVVTGATVALRRDLLVFAQPFVNGWLHDEWLAICAAAKGRLGVIEEPLVQYRQHSNNQCGMRPSGLKEKLTTAAQSKLSVQGTVRLERLLERLENAEPNLHKHIRKALAFERARIRSSRGTLQRIFRVLKLSAQGGYFRYADGFRSIAKDLLSRS
ncbi:MAG TPA: glycosyltransferase family 2 protein [Nitrosomonas sp.]|nr:glycosyltransferase family 2 protein [Nitrosomonas sp.]